MIACRQALASTQLPAARALIETLLLSHQARIEALAGIVRATGLAIPDLFSEGRGFATPGFVCAALRGTGNALRALRIDEQVGRETWAAARKSTSLPAELRGLAAAAAKELRELLHALDAEISGRVWEAETVHALL